MVSTLDSESNNPSSNLGRTLFLSPNITSNLPPKQKIPKNNPIKPSLCPHTLIMLTNRTPPVNFHPFINTHRMENMLTLQYFNRFQMKKLTVTNSTDFFLFSVISSLVLSLFYLSDQTWGKAIRIWV